MRYWSQSGLEVGTVYGGKYNLAKDGGMSCGMHLCQDVGQRGKYGAALYHERAVHSIKFSRGYGSEN